MMRVRNSLVEAMADDKSVVEFDHVVRSEELGDHRKVALEQQEQLLVDNVAGRNHQQAGWFLLQDMQFEKVTVFADDNATFGVGDVGNIPVGRKILRGQIGRMNRVVALSLKPVFRR